MNDSKPPNRIRELRDSAGLSIRDLAAKTGFDTNTVHRLETGAIRLDVERMRRIAQVFGVKPSVLLNNEDVEFRADEDGMRIIAELEEVPVEERAEMLHATREIVRIARIMAARRSAAALGGDSLQVGMLADIWNEFDHGKRQRAIDLLKISGLTE